MVKKKARKVEAELVHPIKFIKAQRAPEAPTEDEWNSSQKEVKFLVEYLKGVGGTEAVIKAGYTNNKTSAAAMAYKLLKRPRIAAIVKDQIDAQMVCANITGTRILKELYTLATANIRDAFDAGGNLLPIHKMPEGLQKSISSVEVEEPLFKVGKGQVTKIKFWSKNHACELLAKHLKLLVDRLEIDAKGFEGLKAPVINEAFVESKENLQSSPGMEEKPDGPAAQHPVPGEVLPA